MTRIVRVKEHEVFLAADESLLVYGKKTVSTRVDSEKLTNTKRNNAALKTKKSITSIVDDFLRQLDEFR